MAVFIATCLCLNFIYSSHAVAYSNARLKPSIFDEDRFIYTSHPVKPSTLMRRENHSLNVHSNFAFTQQGEAATLHLRAVRVYIYEGLGVDWVSQCNGVNSTSTFFMVNDYPDLALHRQLQTHPWRTWDPSEADVFFVPAYLDMSLHGHCGDHRRNLEAIADMLGQSAYFKKSQESKRNHLISVFSCDLEHDPLMDILAPYLDHMIMAKYEKRGNWQMAVPYGAFPMAPMGKAARDLVPFHDRQHSLFLMGQADNRFAYRERRIALRKLPQAFPDAVLEQAGLCSHPCWWEPTVDIIDEDPYELHTELPICDSAGPWNGCHAEGYNRTAEHYLGHGMNSKFFLVIHGDSPSSGRLYDAVQFQAVPIIISDGFERIAMPFPEDVDWKKLVVFVDQASWVRDPVSETQAAIDKAMKIQRLHYPSRSSNALVWSEKSHCVATAVLSHIAREFLGVDRLMRASDTPFCTHSFEHLFGDVEDKTATHSDRRKFSENLFSERR